MADIGHSSIPFGELATSGGAFVLRMLVQFPAVSFTLALLTDILYRRTAQPMWHDFSSWLLFAGLIFGGLAILTAIVDMMMSPQLRSSRTFWAYALCGLVVLLLAAINSLVHAGDSWAAVSPWGICLSALTVVAMVVTSWVGRPLTYRRS